jgi:hypothetical protein
MCLEIQDSMEAGAEIKETALSCLGNSLFISAIFDLEIDVWRS